MVAAVEQGQPEQILRHVSVEFESEDGLQYPDVDALVMTFLLRDESRGARLEDLSIDQESERLAHVRARVHFASGTSLRDRAQALPPGAVSYSLDLVFRRLVDRWQAISGRYERL